MSSIIQGIINIGVTPDMDSFSQRSVRLVNAIVLIVVSLGWIGEVYSIIFNGFILEWFLLLAIEDVFILGIIFLNYKQYYRAAKTLILILANISLLAISLLVDRETGAGDFYFLNFILYILLIRKKWKIALWSLITFGIFTLREYLYYYDLIRPVITSSDHLLPFIRPLFFFIISICVILVLIFFRSENERYEKELSEKIKTNELLLKEVHHRVKNNLQVIISLLDLQMDKDIPENSRQVLKECKDRIYAMFMVHDNLLKQNNLIALNEYIESLCIYIQDSFPRKETVNLQFDIQNNIDCDMDNALLLGIVINELVYNSYKHAFNSSKNNNTILVGLKQITNNIVLTIRDNGTGVKHIDSLTSNSKNQLGLSLVRLIGKQLNAHVTMKNDNGFCVTLTFPKKKDNR